MRTSIWLLVFLHQILCFLVNPQNSPIRPKPVLVGAEAYCRIKAPNSQCNKRNGKFLSVYDLNTKTLIIYRSKGA